VIIANGIDFADALSGSYLAGVKGAPILLSFNDEYNKLAVEYIQANLAEDGIVYILGGEKAVPKSVDKALSGYAVKRLAGANRFETNLLILKEVGVGNKDILVCTGTNFADSLAASATGLPILLVYNDLFDSQKGFLSTLGGQNNFRVIGGTSAVSEKLETSVSIYGETDRVFGTNRISTSVAIANEFFSETDKIVLASAANYPDGLCGGSLACSMGAPLLLTMERFEAPIAEYVSGNEISKGMILGGQSAVSDAAADASFAK
jgi:putative cell wall-binding protein